MLASCIAVEHGAEGQVESNVVFMATHNAEEVKTELCQVQILL